MNREDLTCPHCGEINDFAGSFLGILCHTEHHRCRWCGAQWFVDEVEDDFIGECERVIEFMLQIPEGGDA